MCVCVCVCARVCEGGGTVGVCSGADVGVPGLAGEAVLCVLFSSDTDINHVLLSGVILQMLLITCFISTLESIK